MTDSREVDKDLYIEGKRVSRRTVIARSLAGGAVGVISHFLPSSLAGRPARADDDCDVGWPCEIITYEAYCGNKSGSNCCSGQTGYITIRGWLCCPCPGGLCIFDCPVEDIPCCCWGGCAPCDNRFLGYNYRC
jgi:hypothetical protein